MGKYTDNLGRRNRLSKEPTPPVVVDPPIESDIIALEVVDGKSPIKLWLDDERPPSADPYGGDGWIWVKSIREARKLLDDEKIAVSHMSLDWHLGDYDGSGIEFIKMIFEYMAMTERPEVFANTVQINCHSSDRTRRVEMSRLVKEYQQMGICNPHARVSIHQAK